MKNSVENYVRIGFKIQFIQYVLYLSSLIGFGYPIVNFFIGYPGIFDDFLNPFVMANTLPVLEFEILKEPSFNSPFSPFQVYYYQKLGFFIIKSPYLFAAIVLTIYMFIFLFTQRALYGSWKLTLLFALTAPFYFTFFRGNIALLLVSICSLGFLCLRKDRFYTYAALISLLACFQLPYIILLGPLILARKFKQALTGLLLTFLGYAVPFAMLNNGFWGTWNLFTELNSRWYATYVTGNQGLLHGCSLLGFEKSVLFVFGEIFNIEISRFQSLLEDSYIFQILIVLLVLAYRFRRIFGSQFPEFGISGPVLLVFTSFFILLPQVSAEYKLIFLIPVFGQLLHEKSLFLNKVNLILLALLLIPKYQIWITFERYSPGLHLGSILTPLLLIVLIQRSIHFEIHSKDSIIQKKNSKNLPKK